MLQIDLKFQQMLSTRPASAFQISAYQPFKLESKYPNIAQPTLSFQFCFLHSFFWMNVLSYDIYWKFHRTKSRNSKKSQKAKLLRYSIYAVGSPLFITTLTLILEFMPDSYQGIRANFGQRLVVKS